MDMPYAATLVGGTIFVFVMIIFVVQEFTNGWDAPTDARDRDEKWVLLYLEALPVLLVSLAAVSACSAMGPSPIREACFRLE